MTAAAVACGLLGTVAAPAEATPGGTTWLCRPDMPRDPCDLPNDTTDMLTGKRTPATSIPEADKKVDCFYVYPTVTDTSGLVADRSPVPAVRSIARFQAAPFADRCRIFAPVYRQMTLWGLTPAVMASWVGNRDLPAIGYGDVRRAWREYLRTDNNGRGVIFIGHSQGTMVLRKLIREEVDPHPAVRKKLVGAFLMGGNMMTARGATTGGDFRNIPICTRRGEFGCVTAYSTDLIAGLPSLFGNSSLDLLSTTMHLPTGPRYRVACTDPLTLSGDRRPVGVTVPSRPYAMSMIAILMKISTFPGDLPTSTSTWTTGPGRFAVRCADDLGSHRLHATPVVPQHFNELPLFDTHLVDVNLGLDRLVSIARQQTAAYLAQLR
ncbi:DUF3089 domain-containing protein [Gordonia shandongensis]|uniref:DUF3089 domain-containing protein n=1 Tax=Gordonia shandongensis TaxID=376351 RepID=UPI0006866336|nr:DUF3089 domain-containing protein [Gordonia shandongensis]